MTVPFPEPTSPRTSRADVLLDYLAHFRSVVVRRLEGLSEEQLRVSRLLSGWAPLELLVHLRHVERRWLVWGFEGEPVADPWGDQRDGRWHVPAGAGLSDLVEALQAQAAVSEAVVRRHRLDDVGRPGERWEGADPASLERVLLHLLQEYARHAGHLDVVRELLDGDTGESSAGGR